MMWPTRIARRLACERAAQSSSGTSSGAMAVSGNCGAQCRRRAVAFRVGVEEHPPRVVRCLVDGGDVVVGERGLQADRAVWSQREPDTSSAGQVRIALAKDVFDPIEEALVVLVADRRRLELLLRQRAASCSSSFFCSSVSFFGVTTLTVTSRSPRPRPLTSGMPRPRRRNVVPVCVPSGTWNGSSPSSVGNPDLAAERQRREVQRDLAVEIVAVALEERDAPARG